MQSQISVIWRELDLRILLGQSSNVKIYHSVDFSLIILVLETGGFNGGESDDGPSKVFPSENFSEETYSRDYWGENFIEVILIP